MTIASEFGTVIRVRQIRDGSWEASIDGIRCCLAPSQRIAVAVAKGLDRHRAERREGSGLDFGMLSSSPKVRAAAAQR